MKRVSASGRSSTDYSMLLLHVAPGEIYRSAQGYTP
jgi:hypothetical protein